MSFTIIEEGLYTTIQDLGRNHRSHGFSVAGPMDRHAMQLANLLVGNHESEAVIEMSFMGPTIQFERDALIAITGADMSANIEKKNLERYRPIFVRKGDTLQFRSAKKGTYCYLAISGGIASPTILGSKSTILRANVDHLISRPLRNGDTIPLHYEDIPKKKYNWYVTPSIKNYIGARSQVIRYIRGPQHDWLDSEVFTNRAWKISTQSNRIGYRLQGEPLKRKVTDELLTEATSFGAIQVPPNGLPIVLMADAQPTGGYPKIGQVIEVDLPKLSQLSLSGTLYFQEVSIHEAVDLWHQHQRIFQSLKYFIHEKYK